MIRQGGCVNRRTVGANLLTDHGGSWTVHATDRAHCVPYTADRVVGTSGHSADM